MAVGAAVGGLAGATAGHGVAAAVNPATEDTYWRSAYNTRPGYVSGFGYDDYSGAYRLGWEGRSRHAGHRFDDVEAQLQAEWERARGTSRLTWEQARYPVRDAWDRVSH